MKRFVSIASVLVLMLSVSAFTGCSQTPHKPTTAGNAGTTALVAYGIAGVGVSQYLALPLCATPPVYPCKTQAINDKLVLADTVAYNAAVAADAAGNPTQADPQIAALKATLATAKSGSTP